MVAIPSGRFVGIVAAATALSRLGEYLHNVADLPSLTLLSPENGLTALVAFGLFLAWRRRPLSRATTAALLGWGLLNLIGGALSVIPFSFLPFYPEQTWGHYAAHVVYGALQLPLIAVMSVAAGRAWRPKGAPVRRPRPRAVG
jgi:hypothetical protein